MRNWIENVGRLACVVAVGIGLMQPGQTPQKAVPTIDFNRDVRPILSNHCFPCHGPDAAQVADDLRLDLKDSAKRVIVPGKPASSLLWQRITHAEINKQMPPVASGVKPLSPAQKETLRLWVLQGGEYRTHWAFVPPMMPKTPAGIAGWGRNDIDKFVGEKLKGEGLTPVPEASKEILLRRVSLGLTGLPPTPDEISQFLADERPNAYELAVDRLLDSPRYGEHQARYWLDAVRYGDTHGLHLDNERLVWPYRDWVIRAFNEDLPFDKFTEWQIAGDLLPNPTIDQLVATGYIRMNPTTNEGGAIEAEFLAKNTFDRVDTTSTIFLGLTVACARCHDHKYDPISQKDYFSLYAFFNSTSDKPLDDNALLPGPVAEAPSPEQLVALRELNDRISRRENSVDLGEASAWIATAKVETPKLAGWEVSGPFAGKDFDEAYATAHAPEAGGKDVVWKPLKLEMNKPLAGIVGKENAAVYVRTTISVTSPRELDVALQSDDGVRVWVNGKLIHDKKVLRGLADAIDKVSLKLQAGDNLILIKVVNAGGTDGLQFAYGDVSAERINAMAASIESGELSKADRLELGRLYLEFGPANPAALAYRKDQVDLGRLRAEIPKTLVASELPTPRPAHVLKRGEYSMPGEKVDRAVPAALGSMPPDLPKNRLGFAKWLTSRQNPVVARVFVNKIWQQHFGSGLVKTSEDFGNQGEWPSHPELLDYLAIRFIDGKGSLKQLHRMIVTSASYRQSAAADATRRGMDPENRLISRGPRFRLDAEVIRDQALFVSGLLNEKMAGKGFRPPQPPGLWEDIAYPSSNTAKYAQDMDDSIFRRSIYLFWKRTSPHPVMLAFDSPMREMCSVRRPITNTPLQALVTLNEPIFQAASRNLGGELENSKLDVEGRIKALFLRTVGRPVTAAEISLLESSYGRFLAIYQASPDQAVAVTQKPKNDRSAELASWIMLSTMLLNSDEFLTQH